MNTRWGSLWRWLLVAAVAVGAIFAIATAGNGGGSGLWILLALACPLMMLFMMGSMHHQPDANDAHHVTASDTPHLDGLTHDEQVRALRSEMTRMNWRQEGLRQELERLEAERTRERAPTG